MRKPLPEGGGFLFRTDQRWRRIAPLAASQKLLQCLFMDMDRLLKEHLSPILEGEGFKRSKRKFLRRGSGFEHEVSLSKGWGLMQGKFAIGLAAHPLVDGFPGMPNLPLRSGDHWLNCRVAPDGLDDKWWWADKLYSDDIDEIVRLLTRKQSSWFSNMTSLDAFSQDWYRQVFQVQFAAKSLGLTSARLAYMQAVIFASLGQTEVSLKIAETARLLAGPKAFAFVASVEALKQRLLDGYSKNA